MFSHVKCKKSTLFSIVSLLFDIRVALVNEVCFTETFKATCPPGTVIVIQSALYGRMRNSRCLHFDDRELNCYADAQPYLESLCNGSIECSIRAGDDMLRHLYSDRCRGSLVPYLDVFYACAHGMQP